MCVFLHLCEHVFHVRQPQLLLSRPLVATQYAEVVGSYRVTPVFVTLSEIVVRVRGIDEGADWHAAPH